MKRLKTLLIVLLLNLLSLSGWSQPGDPGGDPDVIPITGLEILLAAGAAFGAKRLVDVQKKKNKD
ncbi:MAG: hypothetical protein N2044_11395 [Cyclobacteriaceae bacterium]|nr:hypothetical protein [Cyclobacteriaceae bacterium]